jgi:hypothetical protein
MTNPLSPVAQAVLDAFLGDCENTGLQMDDMRENVAATLRAAAEQLDVTNGECPGVTPFEIGFLKGAARCQKELLAIAAELEAAE